MANPLFRLSTERVATSPTDFMESHFLRLSFFAAAILTSGLASSHADQITLVAGGARDAVGIAATEAKLREPFAADFDRAGNLYVVEMVSGNRLLKIDGRGVLTHVAGKSAPGLAGDGGPALEAQFNGPHNLAVLPDGNVLIGDTWNGRVRKVDLKSGTVTTVPGYAVDGPAARGNGPYCITLDFTGTKLYIADLRRVQLLDLPSGRLSVVAGNGQKGRPADGAKATEAPLVDPRAVAPDRQGNVYILERGGNALRVVDRAGTIRTVVNASGAKGGDGDGGLALAATMNGPKHLCVDLDDNVIIADAENHLVRKFLPKEGRIVRVAGTGKKGVAGIGGDPKQCELARPHGVVVHPKSGELFITDSYNNRVLKITK
jgi:DNA-binding beta-propeller fold protein YncE